MRTLADAIKVKNSATPEETARTILEELKLDLADWMVADRDLVWRPAIELVKEENEFVARAFIPGVDAKDIELRIAPGVLLIKGETHRGEYGHTKLMKSVKFPRPVNPARVHAELRDGMLSVYAEIAGAARTHILVPRAA